ncbi:POTRA domain-containing protein [soil metagenome]
MFLRRTALLSLLLSFLLPFSHAQSPTVTGPLKEIRIVGATGNLDLIRTYLVARPGVPAEQINLEAERNLVLSIGNYSAVTVSLEDRGSGPILFVDVVENPRIGEVVVEGTTIADPDRLKQILAQAHLLEPGNVFNTTQAQDAVTTLQGIYRQNGFPFDVPVTLDVTPLDAAAVAALPTAADDAVVAEGDEAPVRVTYTVTEDALLTSLVFEGNTVLDDATLEDIFKPLKRARAFDIQAFLSATDEVDKRYEDLGYRGSKVNTSATLLQDGTLTVNVRELRVSSYDSTAIGVDPSEFTLKPGDLYNYDTLLEDIRNLAQGRTNDVTFELLPLSSGDVRITFRTGPPETAGPVTAVEVEGNTVIPTEDLLAVLNLGEGDTFTSALAAEDFARIQKVYADQGYDVAPTPNFNYLDGTYVQRVTELKIAGYKVTFESENHRTRDFVVTRNLPPVGSVVNYTAIDNGLRTLARSGAIQPLGRPLEPTDQPDEVIVNIVVRELRTGNFQPGLQYDTLKGFSAAVSFGDTNFLGRAHTFNAEATAQTSDVGFQVGASVSYSVPWLYLDILDFQRVPTSLSGSLFSTVETNNSLTQDGQVRVCLDPGQRATNSCAPTDKVYVGEYTRRDSGLGFGVGRQILPNTTLRFSGRGTYSAYILEPAGDCTLTAEGKLPSSCTLPDDQAGENLPQSGLSAAVSTTINFDNRDDFDFPRRGVAASGSVGVGFGNDYRNPDTKKQQGYTYFPLEFGVKSYLALVDLIPSVTNTNHVFAAKLNVGYQFGGAYPTDKYFLVGQTLSEGTLIRGYGKEDFNPSQTYAVGTVEYRYNFGLSTVATQTVIGIVFADIGYASSVPGFNNYGAPLFASAGIGVQVNLGFSALGFFPLRFDYGFSQRHPSGVFSFRVGPVF